MSHIHPARYLEDAHYYPTHHLPPIDDVHIALRAILALVQDDIDAYFCGRSDIAEAEEHFGAIYVSLDKIPQAAQPAINRDCTTRYTADIAQVRQLARPVFSMLSDFTDLQQPRLSVLAGCPGVGKTSLIRCLKSVLDGSIALDTVASPAPSSGWGNIPAKLATVSFSTSSFNHFGGGRDEAMDIILTGMERALSGSVGIGSFSQRLDKLAESARSCERRLVHIVDNIDRNKDVSTEGSIIATAFDLFERLKGHAWRYPPMFVITMRRSTLHQVFLKTRDWVKTSQGIDLLPPVPLADVFRRRLPLLESLVDQARPGYLDKKTIDIHLANNVPRITARLSVRKGLHIVNGLMDAMSEDALEHLASITLGGIRTQLRLLPKLFQNEFFSRSGVTRGIVLGALNLPVEADKFAPDRSTLKHTRRDIIFSLADFISPKSGQEDASREFDVLSRENLFDNAPHDMHDTGERNLWFRANGDLTDYLIKIRLLQFLRMARSSASSDPATATQTAIMTPERAVNAFAALGYKVGSVVTALNSLIKNRLVLADAIDKEITKSSTDSLYYTPLGDYYLTRLLDDVAYNRVSLRRAPLIPSASRGRGADFLQNEGIPSAIETLRIAEAYELERSRRQYQEQELLAITGKKTVSQMVEDGFRAALRHRKQSELIVRIVKALDELSGRQYSFDFDDLQHPDPNYCKSCLDAFESARFGTYRPVEAAPYRLEYINRLTGTGQTRFGAEIFYQHRHPGTEMDGCKLPSCSGGAILSVAMKSKDRAGSRALLHDMDFAFLHATTEHIGALCEKKGLDFISVNVTEPFFLDDPSLCNTLAPLLSKQPRAVLELPDRLDPSVCSDKVRTLQSELARRNAQLRVAIDDIGGSDTGSLEICFRGELSGTLFMKKIDWKYFQNAFKKNRNDLQETIGQLLSSDPDKYWVVEGVETEEHYAFLADIARQGPHPNLCIQGRYVQYV